MGRQGLAGGQARVARISTIGGVNLPSLHRAGAPPAGTSVTHPTRTALRAHLALPNVPKIEQ